VFRLRYDSENHTPLAAVFENLEDGFTIDEIVRMFDGLTREQVKAVLGFAAQSLNQSLQL
jgi:uncharacterized protein (DUF433 family)